MNANNTAGHIGREVTKQALGKSWRFSRWTRQVWVDFADWARGILPNPLLTSLDAIEAATLKDAEILRKLHHADQKEVEKAKAEKRLPILMAEQYKPVADVMVEKAQELANCYLDFNSKQFRSLLMSPPGTSQVLYLLLREHQPEATPDVAYDVMMGLAKGDLDEIFSVTQGRAGGGKDEPKNSGSQAV